MRHLLDFALFILHFHFFAVHRLEAANHSCLERRIQRVERGGRGLFEIQFAGERFDIGGGDVVRGDLQIEVRGLPADGAARSQADDSDLGLELALQSDRRARFVSEATSSKPYSLCMSSTSTEALL